MEQNPAEDLSLTVTRLVLARHLQHSVRAGFGGKDSYAMEIRGTSVNCLIKHIILMRIKHYCDFLDKFPEVKKG